MAEKPIKKQDEIVEADINGSEGESTSVANRPDYQPATLGGVSGEAMTQVRYSLPRLKTAYGVGGLAAAYDQGDFVLQVGGKDGENTLLCHKFKDGKGSIDMIVLTMDTYFKEYISQDEWDAGVRPREFLTTKEVEAAGGTWKMPPWGSGLPLPTFSGAAHLKILVERPDGLISELFGVNVLDKVYAPAVWSLDKGGYRSVAKSIKNASGLALRERGLMSATFNVRNIIGANKKGNTVVTPTLTIAAHHPDEFMVALKDTLSKVSFEIAPEESEPAPF